MTPPILKSKGFWAAVLAAAASFLAGNNTPVDLIKVVVDHLAAK